MGTLEGVDVGTREGVDVGTLEGVAVGDRVFFVDASLDFLFFGVVGVVGFDVFFLDAVGVVDFDLFFDVVFLDAVGFDFFGAIFFEPRSLPLSIPTGHNMSSSLESNEGPRK